MKQYKMTVYNQLNDVTNETRNKNYILDLLLGNLIQYYLNDCTYIKRITKKTLYNGSIEITVKHSNGYKTVYILPFNL